MSKLDAFMHFNEFPRHLTISFFLTSFCTYICTVKKNKTSIFKSNNMKKITFILFALISGTAFAQSATATASAEIMSPMTIGKTTDLNFGKIASTSAGTVRIGTDNVVAGSATRISGTTPTAAAFTVNGANNYAYTVSVPQSITLTNLTGDGGETMTVDSFTHNSTEVGTGEPQTFQVGARLNVGESQVVGNYTGDVIVTVAYD